MSDQILAKLQTSPTRRWMAVGMLMLLAFLLIYMGLGTQAAFGYKVFLGVVGLSALWMARGLHRSADIAINLTREGLTLSNGTTLAAMAEIDRVERGTFAFKPSNGFVVTLNSKPGRQWQPGLFWIMGRKLGVGGVTSPAEGKFMADTLAAALAKRATS